MAENWNLSGLILEGICGTGKTTLFRALVQSDRFVHKPYLSTIALSEHQTQRVLERQEREAGLSCADNLALLDQHVSYLESLRNRLDQMEWCDNNETPMRLAFLLERFHFTHVYHYPHMTWKDVMEIDYRLAQLGCKVCLLTADDATLEQRLFHGRDPGWLSYIKRFGETNDEILEYYSRQQQLLLNLAEKSQLPALLIDTSAADVREVIDQILDFWGAV
jgi:adenylate kinase family enzyme